MDIIKLYNKDGVEIDTNTYRLIGQGSRANVFEDMTNHKVLKVYHSLTPLVYAINEKLFNDLKDINSDVLPQLGECLYHDKKKRFYKPVRAYTSEKIEKDYTDVLIMNPHRFAVDVAGRLSLLSDQLAEKNILLSYPKPGNIIVNKDGAFIVDPDLFEKNKRISEDECSVQNKLISLKYMKMLVKMCAEYRHNINDREEQINNIFNIDVNPNTDLTISLYHKLRDDTILKKIKK